jgi:hypothetical protein
LDLDSLVSGLLSLFLAFFVRSLSVIVSGCLLFLWMSVVLVAFCLLLLLSFLRLGFSVDSFCG